MHGLTIGSVYFHNCLPRDV